MYRYLLIGRGFISDRHVEAIRRTGGELVAVCDIDKTKQKDDVPFFTDWQAALKKTDCDSVVIATPNWMHVEMSVTAARRGRTVICEKPFSLYAGDIIRFAGMNSIRVMMQLRYHPVMDALRQAKVETAHLYVKVRRGNDYWTSWKGDEKQSGGILHNLGVHYFDVLLRILGNNCYKIDKHADERKLQTGELWFTGVPHPVTYHIEISSDADPDRYLEVNGERHRFSDKDNLSAEDLHVRAYEDILTGGGVRPHEVIDLTRFIERLKRHAI